VVAERLADLTTLRVGGPAREVVSADSEEALVSVVRDLDAAGAPLLVIGGGSNVVCSDAGFDGTVMLVRTRGVTRIDEDHGVSVSVQAGEPWDELVAWSVSEGLAGLEAMSGIPGLVGATPIQNVGAYGQDVASVLSSVALLDRDSGSITHLTAGECGFGYRSSRFKREPERWVVLSATFMLRADGMSVVRYGELARFLGVTEGALVPASSVREAVLALRRSKGMVLDPDDHDTWSVGSFFVNPIVDVSVAETFPAACPRYPAVDGVKLSAAWLIESAGIERGWGVRADARARVSTKHVLALTNRGGASASDVLELAAAIRSRVLGVHGITLTVEPQLVGCSMPG